MSGERRFEEEVKEDKYYRIERRYGSFSARSRCPRVSTRCHRGALRHGVLEVVIPKAEAARPKKIAVTVGRAKPGVVEGETKEQ